MAAEPSTRALAPGLPATVVDRPGASGSYRQILRSSAIIGGSSAFNVAIGLVRTKAMAVMLGPTGIGLMGTLTTIADLARIAAEMGINSSGVRQIAESAASGDQARVARTLTVLRWTAIVLGVVGALGLLALSDVVAQFSFGDRSHSVAVAVLAAAVFLRLVADGQGALLQGLRRIGDLARLNAWSGLLSSAATLALVYWLGEDGVALSLVAVAGITLVVSWRYTRKVDVRKPDMTSAEVYAEAGSLLRLGLAFMFSALATMTAAYGVRIILTRWHGLEAAGLYQAAWAIGGIYVAFVLQAMGTDFYPRLVAAANDDAECNRLVNEQTMVSLLLAGAGVLGTLTFAPWVLTLLYTTSFGSAVDGLRWVCLGMAMRVVTWPLGYILVAKGKSRLFVGADVIWSIANVLLTLACVSLFGVSGAGMAFFGAYVLHLVVVYVVCRRLTGFRWSTTTARTALAFAAIIGCVQAGFLLFSPATGLAIGAVAFAACAAWSLLKLRELVAVDRAPSRVAKLFGFRSGRS